MATTPAATDPGQLDDARLVELVKAGDQLAFAELYERYFDPVYDFLARMMRNRAEAEDVAQDTFIRVANSIDSLRAGSSFKSWLFTIARNTALNRIQREKRNRPLVFEDDEGDAVQMDLIDPDRLGSPEEAAQAASVAALVWEAAAGLSPNQYSLLDLHLRQGLDSAEIADVLGVTRNNGYVMLNRLKNAVEESIGAYIMMREGRAYCAELDEELREAEISVISPESRRLVVRHVKSCEVCQQTQSEFVSPSSILGALVPVPAAPGVKDAILGDVLRQWQAAQPADGQAQEFNSQQTMRLPEGAGTLAGTMAKLAGNLLMAGTAAIIAGFLLLAVAVFNPFADDAVTSAPATSGAILTFHDEAGEPVSGIGLAVLYTPSDGSPPEEIAATTNGNGKVDLGDVGPGSYVVSVRSLPEAFAGIESGTVSEFEVAPGERLNLNGIFRTVTD